MTRPPLPTDVLLARQEWIRALARSLVREPAEADDVAQEALVAALRRPPAPERPLGAWFARVVSNLVRLRRRGEARRRVREEERGDPRVAPEPAELLQRVALQQDVVRAVLRLAEPERDAVLLHYFEGLTAAEIARQHGLEAAAVRQRLQRARARLREALDRRYGERGAWSLVLASIGAGASRSTPGEEARTATPGAVTTARVGASWSLKLAVASACVVLLGTLWGSGLLAPSSHRAGATPSIGASPVERRSESIAEPASTGGRLPSTVPGPAGPAAPLERAGGTSTGTLVVHVRHAADGRALEDEVVLLERRDDAPTAEDRPFPGEIRARTDRDGRARITALEPGPWEVGLLRRGDALDPVAIESGRTAEIELAVPLGFTVRGTVRDEHGDPVPGAGLWVGEPWSRVRGHVLATSDEEGRFTLRDLQPDGMHWFGARAPRRAPTPLRYVDARAGEEIACDLVLDRSGAMLTGRVLATGGAPVAGARILVGYESAEWASARGGSPPVLVESGADGGFRLEGLATMLQPVQARARGCAALRSEVELGAGATSTLTLTLEPEPIVAGRVTDLRGEPVAGARIAVRGGDEFLRARARTDEHGRFELRGAPCGTVALEARQGKETRARALVVLAAGERSEWNPVLRPLPRVFGTLLDAELRPIAGRELALWEGPDERAVRYTFTDAEGRYSFEAEEERAHALVVFAASKADFPRLMRTGVVAALDPLDLVLDDPRHTQVRVRGQVLGPGGARAEGITLLAAHTQSGLEHELLAESGGRFSFEAPAGTLSLTISAEASAPLELGPQELVVGTELELGALTLPRPAFASGALHAPHDALALLRMDWGGLGAGELTEGGYRSPPLPPGARLLVVQGDGVERQEVAFEVAEGAEIQRDLVLAPAPTRRVELRITDGAERPTRLVAELRDETGRLRWDWRGAPMPAGPLVLVVSAPEGTYHLAIRSDTGLAVESVLVVDVDGGGEVMIDLK